MSRKDSNHSVQLQKQSSELHQEKQHLGFHFIDNTIPLLPKSEISCLSPYSLVVQPGLCRSDQKSGKQFSHDVGHLMIIKG